MESHDKLTVLKEIKQAALGRVSRREKKKKSWVYERCWHLEQATKRDKCHILWNNYRVNPRFKATSSSYSRASPAASPSGWQSFVFGALWYDCPLFSTYRAGHQRSYLFLLLFAKRDFSSRLGYCLESPHRPLKLGSLSADCRVPMWLRWRC